VAWNGTLYTVLVREVTQVAGRRGSPTLRRRQLGIQLRRLREAAGVTIDQVAERLGFSASKVSRIESAKTGVATRDVLGFAKVYGVPAEQVEALVQMSREAKQKGWWQLYGAVLTTGYVGLEAAADAIHAYEALVVPGLLQTEDYARATIRAARPDIDKAEVEKRVRIRIARQSLLTQDDPLDLWVILDEAVLHRPVGGPDVMRRQLDHLVMVSDLPNVALQVLPFAAGGHAGMDGSFAMLLYREPTDPNLVFAANAAGGLFLEKDDELQRYALIFDLMQSLARPTDESIAMIAALAKEP
jgi:transcriptional regulator with XRE-family HTH domain